jgi:hypothetical protein
MKPPSELKKDWNTLVVDFCMETLTGANPLVAAGAGARLMGM